MKTTSKPKLLVVGLGFQAPVPNVLYSGGLDNVVTNLYQKLPFESTIFVRATESSRIVSFDFTKHVHVCAVPVERHRAPDGSIFHVADGYPDMIDALDFVSAVVYERALPMLHLVDLDKVILHCHDWLTAKAIPLLKRHSNIPSVFSVHLSTQRRYANYVEILRNIEKYGLSEELRSRVHTFDRRLLFEAEGCNEADVVHCVSESTADSVIKAYDIPKSKVKVIYNGVDTSAFVPPTASDKEEMKKVLEKYGITKPFILSTGRFVPEKNHKNLLEAFKLFYKRHRDYTLAVLGFSGNTYDELIDMRERMPDDMKKKVVIHNLDIRPDLAMLYRASDICCFPSLEEAFGVVALEAMASGKPTVVGDVGGLREVIPDALNGVVGLRVDARSPQALEEGLERAFDNREEWGSKARRYVVRNFSWSKIAKEYVKLYEKLT